jgi:hypothetical protein
VYLVEVLCHLHAYVARQVTLSLPPNPQLQYTVTPTVIALLKAALHNSLQICEFCNYSTFLPSPGIDHITTYIDAVGFFCIYIADFKSTEILSIFNAMLAV